MNEFQIVDPRLSLFNLPAIEAAPRPAQFDGYFEIKDTIEAKEGGKNALCSVSLYYPDFEYTGAPWERYLKPFSTYLEGFRHMVDFYREHLSGQTIRAYIGDNVWDEVHQAGLFEAKHVEFVRMQHSSRRSYLGSIWRYLAIDDFDYEYVYVVDVDELPENRMHLNSQELSHRIRKGASSEVHIASAVTFVPEQNRFYDDPDWSEIPVFYDVHIPMRDSSMMAKPSNYCLMGGCTFTRGPRRLPFDSIVPIFYYLLAKHDDIVLYHPPSHQ